MQNTVRLLEIPACCLPCLVRQIGFQQFQQLCWTSLKLHEVRCYKTKAALQDIPFEGSKMDLDDLVTRVSDWLEPVQRHPSASSGNALVYEFHLWNHIWNHKNVFEINIWNHDHTSGAIKSRRRKGRVRSNIRTRSPVMCFPVCLSTYMSVKWVA